MDSVHVSIYGPCDLYQTTSPLVIDYVSNFENKNSKEGDVA